MILFNVLTIIRLRKTSNKLNESTSSTSHIKEKASLGLIKISIYQTILFIITNTYANVWFLIAHYCKCYVNLIHVLYVFKH